MSKSRASQNYPSAHEAIIFWLHAAGMRTDQIAQAVNLCEQTVKSKLGTARELARRHRIWFVSTKTTEEVPPNSGTGMSYLKQLALEAGLKTK